MSILRRTGGSNGISQLTKGPDKTDGIPVKCPKCQAGIIITSLHGDSPVRCHRCNYPMIRRSDLFLIIAACRKLKNASQARYAVAILRRLSEFMPEAGTALGMLPSQTTIPLPLSEQERWNALISAYSAGDERAREGLHLMCQSNPEVYRRKPCGNCGAPKYFEEYMRGKTVCTYCQCTD